jgi:hypothetical protein
MKTLNRALTGAFALATLMPLTAIAQSTPPAAAATATASTDSTTPPSDSAATPPAAPTAPSASAAVTSGATVYGSDGAPVGTIASVAGGNAVVDTGARKATLALNAFGSGPQGPTITVTKSQLEDAVAKATPPAPAASEPPAKARKKGK